MSGALKTEVETLTKVKIEEEPSTSIVVKEEASEDDQKAPTFKVEPINSDSTEIKSENNPLKRKQNDAPSSTTNKTKKQKPNQPGSGKKPSKNPQTSKSNNEQTNSPNPKATQPFKKFQRPAEKGKIKTKGLSDERLKAFGINPKKFQKQLKYGKQAEANAATGARGGAAASKSKPFQQKKNKGGLQNKSSIAAHKNKLKNFLNKTQKK